MSSSDMFLSKSRFTSPTSRRYNYRSACACAIMLATSLFPAFAQISPSAAAFLNGNFAGNEPNGGGSREPAVAGDGTGNWVAVWQSGDDIGGATGVDDTDILTCRSSNNGLSWTFPTTIDPTENAVTNDEFNPEIAAAEGTWIAVWETLDDLDSGSDSSLVDIAFARSTNNGATWTAPSVLSSNGPDDSGRSAQIATNGAGLWIVVWAEDNSAKSSFFTRSTNDGVTWSTPALVIDPNPTGSEGLPHIAAGVSGVWIVSFLSSSDFSGTSGTDTDVWAVRSTNNGVSWSPTPTLINSNGTTDTGVFDSENVIASDGSGNWLIGWISDDDINGAGTDDDLFVARSLNNGLSWSDPIAVSTAASITAGTAARASIAADGLGNWVTTWDSSDRPDGSPNTDGDILAALSNNTGATWSDPIFFNTDGIGNDGVPDTSPNIASDGAGSWIGVWDAVHLRDAMFDRDIKYATFALSPPPPTTTSIHSSPTPGFIQEGDTLVLTAPDGIAYQWRKNGADMTNAPPRITGVTTRTLIIDPVEFSDEAFYTVDYDDFSKAPTVSEPYLLVLLPMGSLPAAGIVALSAAAIALVGAGLWRRRRRP